MKYVHPFPARMAPELAFDALPNDGEADVLDPMMGSGTTLVSARSKGHRATGLDRDPLAVLLANVATRDLDTRAFARDAKSLLSRAHRVESQLSDGGAYPPFADDETKAFVRFWFDRRSRRQLASLSHALLERQYRTAAFLRCAISRMIITKQGGVSLAEDISHSRPHRTRDHARISPFELFPQSIDVIARNARFLRGSTLPRARVLTGDARRLPFGDHEFDYVITSPPYLNAIDYLRGHKLSLVWFGHSVSKLRALRATNVGASRGIRENALDSVVVEMIGETASVSSKVANMLRLYVRDLDQCVSEMARVLRPGGSALFVVGDCAIRGSVVKNSAGLAALATNHGFVRVEVDLRRPLPRDKRYLPPPGAKKNQLNAMEGRMLDEVIMRFRKEVPA
jgi:SAM-dependent methyltransferase